MEVACSLLLPARTVAQPETDGTKYYPIMNTLYLGVWSKTCKVGCKWHGQVRGGAGRVLADYYLVLR